jgi:hypothetical protein
MSSPTVDLKLTGTAEELNLNVPSPVPNPQLNTDYWIFTKRDDENNELYTKVKLLEYFRSSDNYPYSSYTGRQKTFNYETGKEVEAPDGPFYKQNKPGKCSTERTNLANCLRIPGGKNKRAKSIKRKSIKSKRKSQKKNQKTNRGRRNSIKHK